MVKCPFCHYENEDGALFCEQCKSDLAGVESSNAPPPAPTPIPMAEPVVAEAVLEGTPFAVAESIPMGQIPEAGFVALQAEAIEFPPEGATVPIMPDTIASIPVAPPLTPAPAHVAETFAPPLSPASPPPEAARALAEPTVSTAAAPTAPSTPAAAEPGMLPPDAQPRLLVLRGQKRNVEYPIYEGHNFIGRADEKPVDIDLEDQEPPDRVWSSRQHAVITFENHALLIEDLNSSNGTFVNRSRIHPGQPRPLNVSDVVQIGNVQLKVII
jgi:hypothetical protein